MTEPAKRRDLHKGQSETFEYAIGFDIGAQREVQQDAFVYVSPRSTQGHGEVFVIADGMGGMAAGEKASYLVTQAFRERYGELRVGGQDALSAMSESIQDANRRVMAEAEAPGQQGMGSTVVALAIENNTAAVAHVGDSRAYRIDDRGIFQVTRDHSRVQKLVDAGILTAEQAEKHPDAHVLSQAVGRPDVQVDRNGDRVFDVAGHTFLLCSDGLSGMLPDRVIELAVRAFAPFEAATALMDLANDLDASDNIAIAIVSARQPQPAYADAFRAEAAALRQAARIPPAAPPLSAAQPSAAPHFSSPCAPAHNSGYRASGKRRGALLAIGAAILVVAITALILSLRRDPPLPPADAPAPPEGRHVEQARPAALEPALEADVESPDSGEPDEKPPSDGASTSSIGTTGEPAPATEAADAGSAETERSARPTPAPVRTPIRPTPQATEVVPVSDESAGGAREQVGSEGPAETPPAAPPADETPSADRPAEETPPADPPAEATANP